MALEVGLDLRLDLGVGDALTLEVLGILELDLLEVRRVAVCDLLDIRHVVLLSCGRCGVILRI